MDTDQCVALTVDVASRHGGGTARVDQHAVQNAKMRDGMGKCVPVDAAGCRGGGKLFRQQKNRHAAEEPRTIGPTWDVHPQPLFKALR